MADFNAVISKEEAAISHTQAFAQKQGTFKEGRDLERQLQDMSLHRGNILAVEHNTAQTLAARATVEDTAESSASYDDVVAVIGDQLCKAVAHEQRHQVLLDQAWAANAATTQDRKAIRAVREATRRPEIRAADAMGAPILPKREWKPSHRQVAARAGLRRDMPASAPSFYAVAASSASASASAAQSAAVAAAATLHGHAPPSVLATLSAPAAATSAPVSPLAAPAPAPTSFRYCSLRSRRCPCCIGWARSGARGRSGFRVDAAAAPPVQVG